MLFDEALNALIKRLEREPTGSLMLVIDYGDYTVNYRAGDGWIEGGAHPVLTDALVEMVELVKALDA